MSKIQGDEQRGFPSGLAEARSRLAPSVDRYSKRAQRGGQSATEHERLRQEVEFCFGPTYAKFFDVHGRLPYDRKSWFPGYPTNYLERRFGLTALIGVFSLSAILCFGLLPPEVLEFGERAISVIVPRIMASMGLSALITAVVLVAFRLITPKNLAMREAYYEKYQELETLDRETKEEAARRARDERLGE